MGSQLIKCTLIKCGGISWRDIFSCEGHCQKRGKVAGWGHPQSAALACVELPGSEMLPHTSLLPGDARLQLYT